MSRWASILSMSAVSVLPLGCSKYSRRYSLTMCFWAEAGQAYGAATCVSVAAPHGTLVPLNSWVMLSNVTEPPGDASRDIPDPHSSGCSSAVWIWMRHLRASFVYIRTHVGLGNSSKTCGR